MADLLVSWGDGDFKKWVGGILVMGDYFEMEVRVDSLLQTM